MRECVCECCVCVCVGVSAGVFTYFCMLLNKYSEFDVIVCPSFIKCDLITKRWVNIDEKN